MWIEVSAGRLNVNVAGDGDGDGEAILLIHGWPLDQRMFAPQVGAFREHFRVISYDRRGFGLSEAPPGLSHELDDIDKILDALGESAVHLLGMSQGGRIALRYAATRPARIASLLLQGAVIDGFRVAEHEHERVPLARYAELARNGRLGELVDDWLCHPMMSLGDSYSKEKALLRQILERYRGADLLDMADDNYAFEHDVLAALSYSRPPTLLLTGAHETPARRLHARELQQAIPACREVVFEDSGHLCNLTEPALYNQVVIDFCKGVRSG